MATIGVKKVTVFKMTKDDATGTTYDAAVKLAPTMKVSLTAKTAEGSLYGDDRLVEWNSEITEFDVAIDLTDLTPEQLALLLGHNKDVKGGVTVSGDDVAPYFGLSFESKRSDGKIMYVTLYKVKFSIPTEEYETKGENISFKTPSITGKAIARESDGNIKYTLIESTDAKTIIDNWYTAPQKKATA